MLEATAQRNRLTGRSGLKRLMEKEGRDRSIPAPSFSGGTEPSPDNFFNHGTASVPLASVSSL